LWDVRQARSFLFCGAFSTSQGNLPPSSQTHTHTQQQTNRVLNVARSSSSVPHFFASSFFFLDRHCHSKFLAWFCGSNKSAQSHPPRRKRGKAKQKQSKAAKKKKKSQTKDTHATTPPLPLCVLSFSSEDENAPFPPLQQPLHLNDKKNTTTSCSAMTCQNIPRDKELEKMNKLIDQQIKRAKKDFLAEIKLLLLGKTLYLFSSCSRFGFSIDSTHQRFFFFSFFLFLSGTGESGKSTIAKQMKVIHSGGFSEMELKSFTLAASSNTIQSMEALVRYCHKQGWEPSKQNKVTHRSLLFFFLSFFFFGRN
jgi:hypothetical protein